MRAERAGVNREAYPDMDEFVDDLTGLYRSEIEGLAAEGCTYFQIDNTGTAILCDPKFQEAARARDEDSQDVLLRRIEEAAKYVPLDCLALSPQCGFASVASWS